MRLNLRTTCPFVTLVAVDVGFTCSLENYTTTCGFTRCLYKFLIKSHFLVCYIGLRCVLMVLPLVRMVHIINWWRYRCSAHVIFCIVNMLCLKVVSTYSSAPLNHCVWCFLVAWLFGALPKKINYDFFPTVQRKNKGGLAATVALLLTHKRKSCLRLLRV